MDWAKISLSVVHDPVKRMEVVFACAQPPAFGIFHRFHHLPDQQRLKLLGRASFTFSGSSGGRCRGEWNAAVAAALIASIIFRLLNHSRSASKAPASLRFWQNRDNIPRAGAYSSQRANQLLHRRALFQQHAARLFGLHRHVSLLGYLRSAASAELDWVERPPESV